MKKQICIKEFIKLRKLLTAVLIVHAGITAYTFIRLKGGFSMNNPILIWSDIIEKGSFFFGRIEKPLLVTGIVTGFAQFYPEVEKKRFRISCHLPLNECVMTATMMFFGLSAIFFLWLFDTVFAYIAGYIYFPREIYSEIPVITSYWLIKASMFYIFTSILTLEPSWPVKVCLGIMLISFINIAGVYTYNSNRLYLALAFCLAAVCLPLIFYPALRFRKGV